MKNTRFIALGFVFGLVLGWALGFLRLPYFHFNSSFIVGLFSGVVLIIIGYLIARVLKLNKRLFAQLNHSESKPLKKSYVRNIAIASVVLILGGLISFILISSYFNQEEERRLRALEAKQDEAANQESIRQSYAIEMVNGLQKAILQDLEWIRGGALSPGTLKKISQYNELFKPTITYSEESLSQMEVSAERGYLLHFLTTVDMDSTSWTWIKENLSFEGADLTGLSINDADLSGINLSASCLKNSQMKSVDLSKANLRYASMWKVNLDSSDLNHADLSHARAQWASINSADMRNTLLVGTDFSNASLSFSKIDSCNLQYAQVYNAFLRHSSITHSDMRGAKLNRSNLTGANLSFSDIRKTMFEEATLSESELQGARVQTQNWLENLVKWNAFGVDDIARRFHVFSDSTSKNKFILEKK